MPDRCAVTSIPSFIVWPNPADVTVSMCSFWRKETNLPGQEFKRCENCTVHFIRGACSNRGRLFLFFFYPDPTHSSRHGDTKGRGNSPGIRGEREEERGSLGLKRFFRQSLRGKGCLDWTFFSPLEFLEYVWALSARATSSAASSHSVVNQLHAHRTARADWSRCGFYAAAPPGWRGEDLTEIQCIKKSWKLPTASRDGNH